MYARFQMSSIRRLVDFYCSFVFKTSERSFAWGKWVELDFLVCEPRRRLHPWTRWVRNDASFCSMYVCTSVHTWFYCLKIKFIGVTVSKRTLGASWSGTGALSTTIKWPISRFGTKFPCRVQKELLLVQFMPSGCNGSIVCIQLSHHDAQHRSSNL